MNDNMKLKDFLPIVAMSMMTAHGFSQQTMSSGITPQNLDLGVKPGTDFYGYACGGWIKSNPLPAAYSRFGTFDELWENSNKQVNEILKELLEQTYTPGSVEQKLSDLYKMAMDSTRREKEGVAIVKQHLKEFDKAKTNEALFKLQLQMANTGDKEFYSFYISSDDKNAKDNIMNVVQGGIALRQKEYYLDEDEATVNIREAYKKHIVKMFKLFGYNEKSANKKMLNIMRLETALAQVSKSQTELRDVEANYHKMTLKEFAERYPNLKFEQVANATGIKSEHIQTLVVGQPEFLDGANILLKSITPDEYRDYLQWGVIESATGYLTEEVAQANFEFWGKTMTGSKEMHPLWKRATNQVQSMMGEALGRIYVAKYFPESSKQRMKTLVANLQKALGQRIMAQDWMSDETKAKAIDKLNSFYVKIGYPDKWTDMSELVIDPSKSYYENVLACRRFWTKHKIDERAGKPVDRDEWHMTPQTVNAYYNPTTNEICFPAGILQPPFFDPNADDAFNYGAIGVVIGHEMTHGFDDQGRHYDKNGNMCDWWTEQDAKNFSARADVIADFFSNINVLPDLKANGRFTLGENLADHGGLMVSWAAYKEACKNVELPVIDGLTADQRFFIAYSGVWAANITEEAIRNRTKSDPHSLGKWRVNGTLPHIDAWYQTFGITEHDPMYVPASERLNLW